MDTNTLESWMLNLPSEKSITPQYKLCFQKREKNRSLNNYWMTNIKAQLIFESVILICFFFQNQRFTRHCKSIKWMYAGRSIYFEMIYFKYICMYELVLKNIETYAASIHTLFYWTYPIIEIIRIRDVAITNIFIGD